MAQESLHRIRIMRDGRWKPTDIKAEPDKFYFTVESSGALKPEEILLSAISVLQSKLGTVQLQLEAESRNL